MSEPALTMQSICEARGWDSHRLYGEVRKQWFSGKGQLTKPEMDHCVDRMREENFRRRPILITVDITKLKESEISQLDNILTDMGFAGIIARCKGATYPVFAQSLDGLPVVDPESLDLKSKMEFAKECSIVNVLRERAACEKIALDEYYRTLQPGDDTAVITARKVHGIRISEQIRARPEDFKTLQELMEMPPEK